MIGERFGKFEITDRLGEGGMGVVYEARDEELGRKVALKMLPAETAQDAHRLERFRREARAVASLNHPNIVTIYGIESAADRHVLVMERIDGESLDGRIGAGGMPQSEIFEIAIPVAEALVAAHAGGVVHRDVKPSNVMITRDGHVKVLDFGLAKVAMPDEPGDASPEEAATRTRPLTGEGVVVGTAPYMSPEQLQGGRVDERSDVFSFGVVLYEMATGKRPFDGRSGIEVASSVLKDIPESASDLRTDLPRHLGRIIEYCLQKDPDERFQTMRDVRNQLANLHREATTEVSQPAAPAPLPAPSSKRVWVIGAVAVLIVGLGGFALWRAIGTDSGGETTAATNTAGEIKIVVLPFENLGSPDDEYFADGMTDEITSRLGATDGLAVIARSSARQFKEARPSLDELAEEFGVDYVLEGTVRWARQSSGESRVRILPSLVRVSDEVGVWSGTFDAVLADIFEVQSEIAQQVSGKLGVALLEASAETSRPTESLEAYDAYLRGTDYYNRGAEYVSMDDYTIAIQMLEEAVRLDPDFAEAHARLSLTQVALYQGGNIGFGDSTRDRLDAARTAANRALELDPDLATAHHALGDLYKVGKKDLPKSLQSFQRALESQPSNAEVYRSISDVQQDLGLWEDALVSMRKAMELNPRLSRLACETGGICLALRRYDEAARLHDRAIELAPDRPCPWYCQVEIHLKRDGNTREARAILERLPATVDLEAQPPINYVWVQVDLCDGKYDDALERLASNPNDVYSFGQFYVPKEWIRGRIQELLGHPEAARDHFESTLETLEEAVQNFPDNDAVRGALGVVYAALGRRDDALREGNYGLELLDGGKDDQLGYRLRDLAEIHLRLGELEQAIDYLDQVISIPSFFSAAHMAIDPTWSPLRDDPRFQAMLKKHGA